MRVVRARYALLVFDGCRSDALLVVVFAFGTFLPCASSCFVTDDRIRHCTWIAGCPRTLTITPALHDSVAPSLDCLHLGSLATAT